MLPDSFSIDLILRHPWRSTRSIAKALSVKPQTMASKRGIRRTYFKAVLQSGHSPAKFQLALRQVVRFLRKNEKFWEKCLAEKGSGEIVFNHTIFIFPQTENGDKCFELSLTSVFCEHLSASRMGLKIQGWVKKSS
jgi:hypothetical protein